MLKATMSLDRAYYSSGIDDFLSASPHTVLGEVARNSGFAIELGQRDAWVRQVEVLKEQLIPWAGQGHLFFEFVVPRMGRRIDVLVIIRHAVFVIEFKVGESNFTRSALDQVWDYALDLKNFHEPSHGITIATVLIATETNRGFSPVATSHHNDGVLLPIQVSPSSLQDITRDFAKAKQWLRSQARGSERFGIVVSSQAERLRPHAINVRSPMDPVHWFLDDKDDVRSSYYLEDVATEFQVQGLELDWACVVWDADLRIGANGWRHHQFVGNKWQNINKAERQTYLKNAYRVLLTRARQGMVIVVPQGDCEDHTRDPSFYDPIFEYLKGIGLAVL